MNKSVFLLVFVTVIILFFAGVSSVMATENNEPVLFSHVSCSNVFGMN